MLYLHDVHLLIARNSCMLSESYPICTPVDLGIYCDSVIPVWSMLLGSDPVCVRSPCGD